MHPAFSIILFTTLSGLGFGMIAWLGLGAVPGAAQQGTSATAFILTAAGLSASVFHLGHPERAWRAISQWRSSWLSREGIMAMLTLGLLMLWWFFDYPGWVGLLMSACALISVYTTSMIYTQMRSVAQWNTPWTVVVFIGLALAGGGLVCALAGAWVGESRTEFEIVVAVLIMGVWLPKVRWWKRSDGEVELSSVASATGLAGKGQVRMLESPHSGSNYLLTEMGFRVARKHVGMLRRIAVLAGGALPLLGLGVSLQAGRFSTVLLLLAVLIHIVGVLAERWLFFAEARHAVMSFYE